MSNEQPNEAEIEKGWRRHFKLHMLSLEHENPPRFVQGPWRRRNRVEWYFLLYKILLACVMVGSLFWTWIEFWNGGKWFVFLTHWGFLAVVAETLVGAILVTVAFVRQFSSKDDSNDMSNSGSMPIGYKIFWCLYNIGITCALYITIMYWSIIYNPENEEDGGKPSPLNFMVHAGNSVAMVLELLFAGPPSRLLHALHPIAFAVVYMIFNVIYWAAGGTDPKGNTWIYEVLKWEDPVTCIILVLISAVLIIILHIVVSCVAGLRSRLAKKCRRLSTKTSSTTPIWATQQSLSSGNFNKSFVTDIP